MDYPTGFLLLQCFGFCSLKTILAHRYFLLSYTVKISSEQGSGRILVNDVRSNKAC